MSGRHLLDCDYSSVEARIVCWLAGQEDALDEYRQGVDRYKGMASVIYNVPVEEVNKHPQRFVGKQVILGAGFGMGPDKFIGTCWKMGRYKVELELATRAIKAFRAKHKKIVKFWYELDEAAQKAILHKGETFSVGAHLSFRCGDTNGLPFLLMRLPSGRKLAYPRPKIVPSRKFVDKSEINFFGKLGTTVHWGDVSTWGGTLAENATQAVAADIMCAGAQNAENDGFGVMALIHDQALSYTAPGQTASRFVECLTDMPAWADGLPIEAEGGEVPFYKKD